MIFAPVAPRRSGVTLIEVLVSIFVASIGLLALLALFPVGALSMKQALKDSRCAQLSLNATSLYRSRNIGQDPIVVASAGTLIFIDPIGLSLKGLSSSLPVANTGYPSIPRVNVSFVLFPPNPLNLIPAPTSQQAAMQNFLLLDDIYFQPPPAAVGQANLSGLPNSPVYDRDPRYSFAYMVRRPSISQPSITEMTVVTYVGRSLAPSFGTFEENAYSPVAFNTATTQVTVPYTQARPIKVKPGGWILDSTMLDATGSQPEPHGYFYRVVDVIDNGLSGPPGTGSVTLDLQGPPRQSSINPVNGAPYGVLIVLDNVGEIFEKGVILGQ
jgi:prepilin-type N-terminal cleavage/methylation domain-containing protein